MSGWLLAFTLSLDDLVITSFVAGPGSSTLPMVIFSKVRLGVSPDINALATILVGDRRGRRARSPASRCRASRRCATATRRWRSPRTSR